MSQPLVSEDEDHVHEPTLLCSGPVGSVMRCSCGHLSVNLQYLTLRFEAAAFRELVGLIAIAQHRLDHDAGMRSSGSVSGAASVH
jgi:hypothetical protein